MAYVTDTVCRTQVDDADAAGHSDHEGLTYYFCDQDCKDKFDADPQDYMTESEGFGPEG